MYDDIEYMLQMERFEFLINLPVLTEEQSKELDEISEKLDEYEGNAFPSLLD